MRCYFCRGKSLTQQQIQLIDNQGIKENHFLCLSCFKNMQSAVNILREQSSKSKILKNVATLSKNNYSKDALINEINNESSE